MDTTWAMYVRALSKDEPQDLVGRKVGINGSTVNRWRNGSRPGKPAEVAAFAIAYGGNVLEAFVAAGFLTPGQAKVPPPARPDWDAVSDEELLEQVAERMAHGDAREHGGAMSAAGDSTDVAMAAHEDASITGEQEKRNEP
jgi:DNA-binding transcriptional regulator YdaS (Cro superfamily)